MSDERQKSFPYTTPSGHTYHAPTDYSSLSNRVMDYLQSVIECWDEAESPANPLAFAEFAKFAWNEAVRANEENERLRLALLKIEMGHSKTEPGRIALAALKPDPARTWEPNR